MTCASTTWTTSCSSALSPPSRQRTPMPDLAVVVDLETSYGYPVPLHVDKGDVLVVVAMDPPREVCVGRTPEPEPGDGPYVAFLTYVHKEDHAVAWDAAYGAPTPAERLLNFVFKTGGDDDPEPELPTEVVL